MAFSGVERMKYRMLVADLDGTILNSRDELTPTTVAALQRCQAAGCRVILATGRCYRTALPVIRQLGLANPVICNNGSLIKNSTDDATLESFTFTPALLSRLVEAIGSAGQSACLHVDGYAENLDFAFLPGQRVGPQTERLLEHFRGGYSTISAADGHGVFERCLAVSVAGSQEALEHCQRGVEAVLAGEVRTLIITAPNFQLRLFEAFPPQVSKWAAALRVAQAAGIAREEIMAVGDDVNDVEMVREAGLGMAMGNAVAAVKAVADHVALTNDQDGLAAALKELIGL
jgi:hypothetical protein